MKYDLATADQKPIGCVDELAREVVCSFVRVRARSYRCHIVGREGELCASVLTYFSRDLGGLEDCVSVGEKCSVRRDIPGLCVVVLDTTILRGGTAVTYVIVAAPKNLGSAAGTIYISDTSIEVIALDEKLRIDARIDASRAIACAVEVIVEHVETAKAGHWHAGVTALAPHVVGPSDIELGIVGGIGVAAATKVGVLVHVGTLCIAEGTPADGHKVRLLGDVHVAVLTIHEVAMVDPNMICATDDADEVGSAEIHCTRATESDVAEDEILAARDVEDARLAPPLSLVVVAVNHDLTGVELCLFADFCSIGEGSSRSA